MLVAGARAQDSGLLTWHGIRCHQWRRSFHCWLEVGSPCLCSEEEDVGMSQTGMNWAICAGRHCPEAVR